MSEYVFDDYRVEVNGVNGTFTVWIYQWLDESGLPWEDDYEEAGEWLVGQSTFGDWVDVREALVSAFVENDIVDEDDVAEVVAGLLGGK